ncbi:MAG: DUF4388 domain-containing protein [Acidobacteriota bacterium]
MKIFKKLFDSASDLGLPFREKILLVEANEQDAALCFATLAQANFEILCTANCAETFGLLAAGENFHAIITDFHLPDGTAVELLRYAKECNPDLVGIVVAREVDEKLLLDAIHAGASYCIPKTGNYTEHLPRLIKLSREQQLGFKALADAKNDNLEDTGSNRLRASARTSHNQQITEYKGQIAATTIPRLLRTFYQQQSTGTLHITHNGQLTSLYFLDGTIVFVCSSSTDERLGEKLVQLGRITLDDYQTACKLMASSGMRFGTALTTLGIIKLEELKPLVVQHVLALLYSTFDWENGEFVFEYGAKLENEVMLSLSTADVIFAGIRHLKNRDLIDRWLGDCDRILIPTTDPFALFQALTLLPEEAAVLGKIDKPMSVNQVRSISDIESWIVSRTLCGLIETGMLVPFEAKAERLVVEMPRFSEIFDSAPLPVDFDARAAAEFCYEVEITLQRFRAGDHYAVLGTTRTATAAEITAAYRDLAKKFHPDRHSQLASYNLNLKTDLKAIFERIAEAYYTLTEPERRNVYDKAVFPELRTAMPEAKTQVSSDTANIPTPRRLGTRPLPPIVPGVPGSLEYQLALTHYRNREFDKARKALLAAIATDPNNPEYRVALARSLMKMPIYIRQAEDAYLKAIELSPHHADYYAELGLLYQQFSQLPQARKMLQRALELDPNNPIALRAKL